MFFSVQTLISNRGSIIANTSALSTHLLIEILYSTDFFAITSNEKLSAIEKNANDAKY